MKILRTIGILVLAPLMWVIAGPALAQSYPTQSVRMVVPYAAGGPLDLLARIFAEKLTTALGQTFFVENKPGANGNLGADFVVRAKPDGYTLLWAIDTQMTVNPSLYKRSMPFDPEKDLAPISLVSTSDSVLVVNPALDVKTVGDLVELAKTKNLNFASGGYGSPGHMSTELFMAETGVKMTHVPYKGNSPAVLSIVSGETQLSISSIPGVLPHIRTGKLRAIAVTGSKRSLALKDLPTFSEVKLPKIVVDGWRALFAPAGTPPHIINRIDRELAIIAAQPDVEKQLAILGLVPVISSPDKLASQMKSDSLTWAKIVKDADIKIE